MSKVVTEKSRDGHSMRYDVRGRRAKFKRADPTEAPIQEGIGKGRKATGQYKSLSDLIGPLQRYLHSKIGHSWNKVFSEIAQHLPANSVSGLHIRGHVKSEVEINPHHQDGKYGSYNLVHYGGRYTDLPEFHGWEFREYTQGELYVDLRGVLRQAKKIPYPQKVQPITKKIVGDRVYEKLEGIWYEVEYETRTRQVPIYSSVSYGFRKDDRAQPPVTYRNENYVVLMNKKQLNRKDLKNLRLVNETHAKS